MRVITRQNIWHQGDVHPTGSLVDLSDELAEQLISDGLVELVSAQAEPAQAEPMQVEKPVKSKRSRKK